MGTRHFVQERSLGLRRHTLRFPRIHLLRNELQLQRRYYVKGTRKQQSGHCISSKQFSHFCSAFQILIYDVIEVVPEPGKPLTKYKLKEVYVKDQKGPVSAISHVLGFLVTAVGQKIYLWQLKDNDLNGVAFIDTNIYVHQIISIKSLLLVADMYKSISLLRFQEEFRTLSLVSRDYNPMNVLNIEYVVDNTSLGFLASDCEENFIMFMYQPEARESYGGQKLIRKADYHVGQRVNAMVRIQCNNHNQTSANYENKHATYFGKFISLTSNRAGAQFLIFFLFQLPLMEAWATVYRCPRKLIDDCSCFKTYCFSTFSICVD